MMTRIYNVCRTAAGALLLTAALAACTDDSREPLQENETPREGIFFNVIATQGEGAETRVSYEPTANGGMNVKWAANDKIYVGKLQDGISGNIHTVLSSLDIVAGGIEQTTAKFEGEITNEHLPANGGTLYAFYGKTDKVTVSGTTISYSYDGQRQTDNDDMKHVAEYDFMTANTSYDPSATTHRFSFSHVGALMKFTLGGLVGKTVKKLTLSTYDGSKVFGSSESFSLDLGAEGGNGISIVGDGALVAYLMMEPNTVTTGKDLVLYVTTTDDKYYATLLTGADIVAGNVYTIDATLEEYTFDGEGNEISPYQIKNAGDLTKLAVMTNIGLMDTQDKFFKLTNDINMAEENRWVPIGGITANCYFKGTFSGAQAVSGNYAISDLPGKTLGNSAGLFGYLSGATIKNVTVSGSRTVNVEKYTLLVGGFAGSAQNSTIENCISDCEIYVSNRASSPLILVGGIIGQGEGGIEMLGCKNQGNVKSGGTIGGIMGKVVGNGKMTNCANSGNIQAKDSWTDTAAGIIGHVELKSQENFSLTICTHSGNTPTQGAAGSIIGFYMIGIGSPAGTLTIITDMTNPPTTISGKKYNSTTGKWPAAN